MKKNKILTILGVALLVLSLISSWFLGDSIGSKVVNAVTIITAVIGAIALFIQFQQDKIINRASFLIEYNKNFYSDYHLKDLFNQLQKVEENPKYKIDYEKYHDDIVSYLEWIEILAALVERNAVDLYFFDNIVSYRFFIITNNKVVQDNELVKFKKDYRGVYYLYDMWYRFKKKRGLEMPLEKTGLHLTKGYQEYIDYIKTKLK